MKESSLKKCVTLLIVVAILMPVAFSFSSTPATAQSDGDSECYPYRIFYSDDNDMVSRTDSSTTNITKIKNFKKKFSPAEFACVADIAIGTTKPNFWVGRNRTSFGYTLPMLQESKIKEYDRARNDSVRFPGQGQLVTNNSIAQAHSTLVGVMGGAQPTFDTDNGKKAIYMSDSGTVMNFADYKVNESADPDVCRPKVYTVEVEEYVPNESTASVPNGGNATNSTNGTNATNGTPDLPANISTSTVQVIQNVTSGTTVNSTFRGESATFDVQKTDNDTSLPTFRELVSGRNLTQNITPGSTPVPEATDSIRILNATQSCSYYTYSSRDVSRSMTLAGNTKTKSGGFDESDGPFNVHKSNEDKDLRTFDYSTSATGNATLNLSATFASDVYLTPIQRTWSSSGTGQSEAAGTWDSALSDFPRITRTDRASVNISKPVVFTDPEDPGITQKVIRVSENEQYDVIDFPSGSKNISIMDAGSVNGTAPLSTLRTRPMWVNMTSENGSSLQGPWNVFSMRARGSFLPYYISSDFPGVPVTRIYADRREPSIRSTGDSDDAGTLRRVIGWKARNLSIAGSTLPQGVNLYAPDPVVMDKVVVQNVEGGFQQLMTVHGETVSLESGIERIPYREPEVNITKTGDTSLDVTVRDPKTNAPLAGRTVHMQGTKNATHVTNADGVVNVTRTGAFVRAKTEADTFQNIGDVFYGETIVSETFNPITILTSRLVNLIIASVVASPLFIALFWWRGVRRDNQHIWQ